MRTTGRSTAKLDRLADVVSKMGEDIFRLPRPSDDQLKLMAFYIQTYNFIELNARRCLETLARANLLRATTALRYRKVADGELIEELKFGVQQMDPNVEDIDAALTALKEIELKKDLRNRFAHDAARDLRGEDALLLLGKDNKTYKRVFEEEIQDHAIVWGVVDMADARGAAIHMQKYEVWIAKKAAEWFERYESAQTIAELKAEYQSGI